MKKISKLLGLTTIVLSCGLVSCSSSDVDENLGETKTVVNMLSTPQPIQLTEEQKVFVTDNNHFTLNFIKTVNDEYPYRTGESFIFSPLSITFVLGMVNDGAVGQTEQEIEQTLGFHKGGIKAVNEYCKNLIDNLPKVDEDVTLNIANAIFLNKQYTLKPQFEQDMKEYYDAKAEALDFSSPETLGHINNWCDKKTKGMIPTILDEVKPNMASYLLNAIYFKADWTSKFDPKNTTTETFTSEAGYSDLLNPPHMFTYELPMMHQNVLINYAKSDICSSINLPFGNGMWYMTIMLPEEGKTTYDIINNLRWGLNYVHTYSRTRGTDDIYFNPFSPHEVDLKLPRFETSSDTDDLKINLKDGLADVMKKMGIHLAFDEIQAEIPNMCNLPVFIKMMRQKAKIIVNEEGSEAAAVTVAGMMEKSAVGPRDYPKATFHANRSFVYVIREASSGVILFVGKFTGA